jgi:fructose-1-phosphate kinase PfkB-like protein
LLLAVEEGLPVAWYRRHSGETRTCRLLNHDDKDATVINENGPPLIEAEGSTFQPF